MAQRQLQDAQLGGLPTADFDYTFTEHELADILGFMENQHQQSEAAQLRPQTPLVGSGAAVPLQFQPHTADSGGQPTTPTHSGGSQSDDGITVKREPSLVPSVPLPQLDAGSSLTVLNGYYPKSSSAAASSRSQLGAGPADSLPLETRAPSGSAPSLHPTASRKGASY